MSLTSADDIGHMQFTALFTCGNNRYRRPRWPCAETAPTSDATRDRLLDAAAAVFAEKGYDRAGVQEIARRAGLTTGAIYGRFTGKADLLQAAIESHTNDELDDLFAQHRFDGHASDILRTVGSHLVMTDCPDAITPKARCCSRRSSPPAEIPRSGRSSSV